MRAHFHRFMRRVHKELKANSGQKNPLIKVADKLAGETRIICFDEFFVSDITDAMLLGGLFELLFERGIILVATSNIPPDQLYKNGLQRQRFLPAIDLIKEHTRVMYLDSETDYRLRTLEQAELYHSPLDPEAEEVLLDAYTKLAPEHGIEGQALEVEGREIDTRRLSDDVVWFDFPAICGGPRSQNDYIEIAREFHAVILSNVPVMDMAQEDAARRFINLIDEFYDRNVKLVVSAAAPIEELYAGQRLLFEFDRTISRLREMQSHEYLAREHRP
jgi:cell division protein ZapE